MQDLLKRVHQESCRILTLSQRRSTASSQHHVDSKVPGSSSQPLFQSHERASPLDQTDGAPPAAPPMGWQQEKRALQETVVALRELLCRMAQRDAQVTFRYRPASLYLYNYCKGLLLCHPV